MFIRLHHVQLAMPPGEEAAARAFYDGVLGMAEIAKPRVLAARSGVWFRAGGVELHLGVEDDVQPARKDHPGVLVDGLDEVVARLAVARQPVTSDADLRASDASTRMTPSGIASSSCKPSRRGREPCQCGWTGD